MAKDPGVLDQLRREIRRAEKQGITRYRLSQLSGVDQGTLSRLMAGTLPNPRVKTVDRIAEALELRLMLDAAQ